MDLKPGMRLRSVACDTEVIVVRGSKEENRELTCGGRRMSPIEATRPDYQPAAAGLDGGTVLGKRYTPADSDDPEVLVVRAGTGTLAVGSTPLVVKEARVLPSSD
jgi:hypothetical protein